MFKQQIMTVDFKARFTRTKSHPIQCSPMRYNPTLCNSVLEYIWKLGRLPGQVWSYWLTRRRRILLRVISGLVVKCHHGQHINPTTTHHTTGEVTVHVYECVLARLLLTHGETQGAVSTTESRK